MRAHHTHMLQLLHMLAVVGTSGIVCSQCTQCDVENVEQGFALSFKESNFTLQRMWIVAKQHKEQFAIDVSLYQPISLFLWMRLVQIVEML